jgi:hypothetical protein
MRWIGEGEIDAALDHARLAGAGGTARGPWRGGRGGCRPGRARSRRRPRRRRAPPGLILLPIAIVVVLLAVANRQPVMLSFDPFTNGTPGRGRDRRREPRRTKL